MHESSREPCAPVSVPIPIPMPIPMPMPLEHDLRLTRGSRAGSAADSPEMTLRLTEDHDRTAEGLNDIVVRRLFSAGIALEAALGLIGEHLAVGRIQHAIRELDRVILEVRDAAFDCGRSGPPGTDPG